MFAYQKIDPSLKVLGGVERHLTLSNLCHEVKFAIILFAAFLDWSGQPGCCSNFLL
jgi:hypothetical protein